jgi:hypothetical protein
VGADGQPENLTPSIAGVKELVLDLSNTGQVLSTVWVLQKETEQKHPQAWLHLSLPGSAENPTPVEVLKTRKPVMDNFKELIMERCRVIDASGVCHP